MTTYRRLGGDESLVYLSPWPCLSWNRDGNESWTGRMNPRDMKIITALQM